MKNFEFWVNDGSRSFKVIVQGIVRYEAESSIKMIYSTAKSISFIREIRG